MKARTTYEVFRRLCVPRDDTSTAPTPTPGLLARHAATPSFVREHGPTGPTLRVVSGSGGHCFFRWPGRPPVSNSVGKAAPGVDVRGDGGYVVAAPSLHDECSRPGVRSPAGLPYELLKRRKGVAA